MALFNSAFCILKNMNKLFLLLLFPLVFFGQSPYLSYYENGNLKVAGESFEKIIGSKVSAKRGLNVRTSPSLKSKKIGKLLYGIPVTIESKTGKKLTVIDGSLQSKERDVPEYIQLDDKNKSAKLIRVPKFAEVPFPVIMEPSLVIEYYSR